MSFIFEALKLTVYYVCLKTFTDIWKFSTLRKGYSLFISTIKPYNSVSRNTLANWLKESLRKSGINLDMFSPHSTRSASTSAVVSKVPLDTIMRTARWKSRKHYKKPVTNDTSLSNEVLSSV